MTTEANPRVAVVTGGLSGIGLAIAKALADKGCRVAVGARRANEPATLEAARAVIGNQTFFAPLDVCNEASVATFCRSVEESCGPIDILVNSAGVTVHQTVCDHPRTDWDHVIETNLTGPFLMIRACLPAMIKGGWGRIINIASTAARAATDDHAAYCASKAGLVGLTRAVALEGAPHGVTCVAVSPTWVETEMLRQSAAKMAEARARSTQDEIADLARSNPQRRLVQPDEIGALVAFLAGDEAAALTMEDIQVNAGAHW